MIISNFSGLPYDILVEILTQLKRISDTTQDLGSCLLVDRRWRQATTPLLYGNVALTDYRDGNFGPFCEQLNVGIYAAYIHSITISSHQGRVEFLAPLLSQFSNLRCFSSKRRRGEMNIVSQSALVQLVEALPPSCTNLEIDTYGLDSRENGMHLCDPLRVILPRMQHVRLCMPGCESIFIDPSTADRTMSLPHLKSLICICASGTTSHERLTSGHHAGKFLLSFEEHLWPTVVRNLQRLVATPCAIPADAQVYAFMITKKYPSEPTCWQAYICADMRAQESLALPFRTVSCEDDWAAENCKPCILRFRDGTEIVSTPESAAAIAEGQLWRDVYGGARLPAALLADARAGTASFAVGCEEKPLVYLKSSAQWRKDNPGKSNSIWVNEEKVGMKLVSAEVRKGKDAYLSLERIKESTPEGWRRVRGGDVLEKIVT